MTNHPLLYEINTRCWLRSLSERHGHTITLANVPDAEITHWRNLGFTHIWTMGIWQTGERSRQVALNDAGVQSAMSNALPGWKPEDICSSPYAVADYRVADSLGGEGSLPRFRQQLKRCGLKLILDFVPNHVGLDHRWLRERPELFVQSTQEMPGTFRQETASGARWIAHGKDPNFAPWPDTAQLDYRHKQTREAMSETLQSIAQLCDGVRCDMAMLQLNEIFAKTWANFPGDAQPLSNEFWPDAIAGVRKHKLEFLFLAEVYWELDGRIKSLGFDYIYDKTFCERMRDRNFDGLRQHLFGLPSDLLAAGAHFLENHDESRIASKLGVAENRAAALLMLGLPGMPFICDGQIEGRRIQVPVQSARWPVEHVDPEVRVMYEELLTTVRVTAVGNGEGRLLQPSGWPDNPSSKNFIIAQWQKTPSEFDLVAVNLAPHRSQCLVKLTIAELEKYRWEMRDLLGHEIYHRHGNDMAANGLYLELLPYGAQLFHFHPSH